MSVVDFAVPFVSVVAVMDWPPFANEALAPVGGAVNVTLSLATGLPEESFTLTCKATAKAVRTTADWPSPPVAESEMEPEPEEGFTVSTAPVLVVLPALSVTTATNIAPLSLVVVAGVVYVADVAPAITPPFLFH